MSRSTNRLTRVRGIRSPIQPGFLIGRAPGGHPKKHGSVHPVRVAGGVIIVGSSSGQSTLTTSFSGDVSVDSTGHTKVGHTGTFVANGATAVTVTDANITATSTVAFGLNTAGGTISAYPYVSAVTPGTSFQVKAGATDTSTYNYRIIG